MRAKTFIILSFIAAQGALAAGPSINDVCLSEKQIQKRVFNCADNAKAAKIAQDCARFVFDRWKETAPDFEDKIQKSLAATGTEQKNSLTHSQLEYQLNADMLDVKLAFFAKYADLVASYPLMMMDSPRGKNDATSAPCFNSAFHSVEKTVSSLDKEIVSTKHAREKFYALDADLGKRIVAVSSTSSSNPSASSSISHSFRGAKTENPQSEVTGTSKDRFVASANRESAVTRPDSSPTTLEAKNASPEKNFTAPATRQIARNKELGGSASASGANGWAGTKVGQEIFADLESAKFGTEPMNEKAVAPEGEGSSSAPAGTRLSGFANGSTEPAMASGDGGKMEPVGTQNLSANSSLAGERSIFALVNRKYRQIESLMKK